MDTQAGWGQISVDGGEMSLDRMEAAYAEWAEATYVDPFEILSAVSDSEGSVTQV